MKQSVRSAVVRVLLAAAFAGAVFAATLQRRELRGLRRGEACAGEDQGEGHDRGGGRRQLRAERVHRARDGHTVVGMDADLAKATVPAARPQGERRQRDVRRRSSRASARQVRRRHVVVHRHEGAREAGQLRRLLRGRHVVLREGPGRSEGHEPREHLRPHGLGRERHDRADRREGTVDEVHEGRQEGRQRAALPDAVRRNLALSSGRAQVGMADSPVAAYQVKQSDGEFKLVGQSLRRRARTASRCRSPTARSTQAILAALKDLIKNGTVLVDPGEVGHPVGRRHHAGAERRDLLSEA